MAVTCKKCGGPHPTWECHASAAKIAAYAASQSTVQPVTARSVAQTVERSDKAVDPVINGEIAGSSPAADHRKVVSTKSPRKVTKRVDDLGSVQDALKMSSDGQLVGGVETTAVKAATSVSPAGEAKLRGRPRKHPDRKAYRAEWFRKRRAEAQRLKEGKTE